MPSHCSRPRNGRPRSLVMAYFNLCDAHLSPVVGLMYIDQIDLYCHIESIFILITMFLDAKSHASEPRRDTELFSST
jgi:hypothetical protein